MKNKVSTPRSRKCACTVQQLTPPSNSCAILTLYMNQQDSFKIAKNKAVSSYHKDTKTEREKDRGNYNTLLHSFTSVQCNGHQTTANQ